MQKNIIFEQIITDIAGNKFLLIYYSDLDGNVKNEIKIWNPEEFDMKKNNLKNKNLYNYI